LEYLTDILPYTMAKKAQISKALEFPYEGSSFTFDKGRLLPLGVHTKRQEVKESLAALKRANIYV